LQEQEMRFRPVFDDKESAVLLALYEVANGTYTSYTLAWKLNPTVASEWARSENNRRAKYYRLTRAGRKRLHGETKEWQETTAVLARFLSLDKQHA